MSRRAIAAMSDVATALLDGRDRDDVLQIIATRARELAGGEVAMVILRDDDLGGIFIPAADGEGAASYRGLRGRRESGVAARVMATGASEVQDDWTADPVFGASARLLGLGPAAFMPIVVDGPYGCLVVARAVSHAPFSPAEVEVVEAFVEQAGVVLEHDRQRQREADRERTNDLLRLAGELQDSALKEIFGAGLHLSAAVAMVTDRDARSRLREAIAGLDRAIKLARQVIFNVSPGTGGVS